MRRARAGSAARWSTCGVAVRRRAAVEMADGAAAGDRSRRQFRNRNRRGEGRLAAPASDIGGVESSDPTIFSGAFDVRGTGARGVGCGRLRCPSTRGRTSEEILSFSSTAFAAGGIVAAGPAGGFNSWARAGGTRGGVPSEVAADPAIAAVPGADCAPIPRTGTPLRLSPRRRKATAIVTAQLLLPDPDLGLEVTLTASVRHTSGSGGWRSRCNRRPVHALRAERGTAVQRAPSESAGLEARNAAERVELAAKRAAHRADPTRMRFEPEPSERIVGGSGDRRTASGLDLGAARRRLRIAIGRIGLHTHCSNA